MPKHKVPRYKVIRCRTCNSIIHVFDRAKYRGYSVPKEVILSAIRNHYKIYHPRKFRESVKRAVAKRRK